MKTSSYFVIISAVFIMAASVATASPVTANSALTLTEAAPKIREQNYCVSEKDGARNVPLLAFNVKNEGVMEVEIITANVVMKAGRARPSTVYLFNDKTLVSSAVATKDAGNICLKMSVPIQVRASKTFTVKADFPAGTPSSAVQAELRNVTTSSMKASPGKPLIGPVQHLMPVVADIQLAAMPTTASVQDDQGFTKSVTATFTMHISAIGGGVRKFEPMPNVPDEVIVVAATADGSYKVICPTMSVTTIPNKYSISEGSTSTVVVTATLPSFAVKQTGLMCFSIARIAWGPTMNSSETVYQTWGLEDFKTPSFTNFVVAEAATKR